jgi:hypothetical protein
MKVFEEKSKINRDDGVERERFSKRERVRLSARS